MKYLYISTDMSKYDQIYVKYLNLFL